MSKIYKQESRAILMEISLNDVLKTLIKTETFLQDLTENFYNISR